MPWNHEQLYQQLHEAGLPITWRRLNGLSDAQADACAVWADAALEDLPHETPAIVEAIQREPGIDLMQDFIVSSLEFHGPSAIVELGAQGANVPSFGGHPKHPQLHSLQIGVIITMQSDRWRVVEATELREQAPSISAVPHLATMIFDQRSKLQVKLQRCET